MRINEIGAVISISIVFIYFIVRFSISYYRFITAKNNIIRRIDSLYNEFGDDTEIRNRLFELKIMITDNKLDEVLDKLHIITNDIQYRL